METKGKVVFCNPSICGPTGPFIKSLEDSLPLIVEAGWEEGMVQEVSNPYISAARAMMARKAIDAKADIVVFLDYDLSWKPEDLLKLIETEGDVVVGTYRFKKEEEEYMGGWVCNEDGTPKVRESDGCFQGVMAPAGFLKVTRKAMARIALCYPELCFGDPLAPTVDLFKHGAVNHCWWGEDYAFCDRWNRIGGDIWLIPNLDLNHWNIGYNSRTGERMEQEFKGNLHEFLLRQPGGKNFIEKEIENGNQDQRPAE